MSTPATATTPTIREMDKILHQRLVVKRTGTLVSNMSSTPQHPALQEHEPAQRTDSSQAESREQKLSLKLKGWNASIDKNEKRKNSEDRQATSSPPNKKTKKRKDSAAGPSRVKINKPKRLADSQGIWPSSSSLERLDESVKRPLPKGKGNAVPHLTLSIKVSTSSVTTGSRNARRTGPPTEPLPQKPKPKAIKFQPLYDKLLNLPPPSLLAALSSNYSPSSTKRTCTTTPSIPIAFSAQHTAPDIITLDTEHPRAAWARLFPGPTFPEHGSGRNWRRKMGFKKELGGWYRRSDGEGNAYVRNMYEGPSGRDWVQGIRFVESGVRSTVGMGDEERVFVRDFAV